MATNWELPVGNDLSKVLNLDLVTKANHYFTAVRISVLFTLRDA